MAWISRSSALTTDEMYNNADIVISTFKGLGFDNRTIAGILANMQHESGINPEREEEGGGGGYGLVQWTPKSKLQNVCSVLGLSPYTSGDVQLSCLIPEILNQEGIAQWYTTEGFITPYYDSGATSDMIGITGIQFLNNEMGWSADKLAILFMVAYERPSYDPSVNHYASRVESASVWAEYVGAGGGGTIDPVIPDTPTGKKRKGFNFVLFNRRRMMRR